MSDTIKVGRITFDRPHDDWTAYVMMCIQQKPLALAGKELAMLVDFALKPQHDEQFNGDVRACVAAYFDRCDRVTKGKLR